MRFLRLLFAFILFSAVCTAQVKPFGRLSGGVGLNSNYGYAVTAGFDVSRFRYELGLRYFTGVMQRDNTITGTISNYGLVYTNEKYRFAHMGMPVSLGYIISIGDLEITPNIGFIISRMLSFKDESTSSYYYKPDPTAEWTKFSLFANAGINVSFKLNRTFALFVAPSTQMMLSSIKRTTTDPYWTYHTKTSIPRRFNCYSLDVGATFYFK